MKIIPKRKKTPRKPALEREEIGYAVGKSSLGAVLVATSASGVVAILVGDKVNALIAELDKQFAKARLIEGDKKSRSALTRVIAFIEKPGEKFSLPLDVRGTDFQRRVWQAVWEIPLGKTSTYTKIARRIGAPRAMRAVGNACSNNYLALVVPCYKVLRSDGSMSKRQRKLIDWENAVKVR